MWHKENIDIVPNFGTRKAVKMGLHKLLEKDLKEGKELMEICENLSEEDRLLTDRIEEWKADKK